MGVSSSLDEDDGGFCGRVAGGAGRVVAIAMVALAIALAALAFAVYDDEINWGLRHGGGGGGKSPSGDAGDDGCTKPIRGDACLTRDEYRDVRVARQNEHVLVTGGLGFIGSHVVDLLLHRGFRVTVLDDESNGHNHNRHAREMVPNDITVVSDLPTFPSPSNDDDGDDNNNDGDGDDDGADGSKDPGNDGSEDEQFYTHVIHLAAAISVAESMTDPDKYERINYDGSRNVLDWVRDYNARMYKYHYAAMSAEEHESRLIRKVVAASSAAVYGNPDPGYLPLRESAPYGGLSPYADTKYRMEGLLRNFVNKQNDLAEFSRHLPAGAAALRFFNVYGPRQDPRNPYSGVISLFLDMASGGDDVTILGDGEMTRDFVYVKDVARAIALALLREPEKRGEGDFDVYNVCTGASMTINALAEQVKRSMGSKSDIVHLDPREGDVRHSSCDPAGAREGMGFTSAVTQEVGLEKTASWFREGGDGERGLRRDLGEEEGKYAYVDIQ